MKTHNWKDILGSAVTNNVRCDVRIHVSLNIRPRYAELQQLAHGYVGLRLPLPRPYNETDHALLQTVGRQMGFIV